MPQLFARPRTPNDNAFTESLFGTIKRARQYPGRFLDLDDAIQYFSRYIPWYNTEHYYPRIDYVTPDQCHQGLKESIVCFRRQRLEKQRQLRKGVNLLNPKPLTADEVNCMLSP
jgi:putative transposase